MIEVNAEKGKEKMLIAQLNIINGTNVHVAGKIYGPTVSLLDSDALQNINTFGIAGKNSKTITVVYKQNATQTRNRKVNLGHRQIGDQLINFETKNVTFAYRFAETEFEYHDKSKHITAVGFSFDVSKISINFLLIYVLNRESKRVK